MWSLLILVFVGVASPTVLAQADGHRHDHAHDHDHHHAAESSLDSATTTDSPSRPHPSNFRFVLLGIYSLLIIAASMLGGVLPSLINLTHVRMQLLISLVGGLMVGIAVFHLIPHAVLEVGPARSGIVYYWLMAGILTMFLMLRAFHFHQHDVSPEAIGPDLHSADCSHEHDHDHGHAASHHGHALHRKPGAAHQLSWVGVFAGLSIHTLIDGAALGASVEAEASATAAWGLFGLGTFLAVALHKPLDALSITSLMRASGWSRRTIRLVNAAFAAMCPLGAALFLLGVHVFAAETAVVVGCALAFAGGVFLCIALSDLLPEMEFHSHHRLRLTAALLLGVALAWGIGFVESEHLHDHGGGGDGHSHAGHAH